MLRMKIKGYGAIKVVMEKRGDARLENVAVTPVEQAEEVLNGRLAIRHVNRRDKYAGRCANVVEGSESTADKHRTRNKAIVAKLLNVCAQAFQPIKGDLLITSIDN